jgi:hypothetical protein
MDVLIVEKNDLLAEVLADAVADDGIEAAVVADDEEALRACQPDLPQVVVTGINRLSDERTAVRPGDTEPLSVACRDLHGGALASTAGARYASRPDHCRSPCRTPAIRSPQRSIRDWLMPFPPDDTLSRGRYTKPIGSGSAGLGVQLPVICSGGRACRS